MHNTGSQSVISILHPESSCQSNQPKSETTLKVTGSHREGNENVAGAYNAPANMTGFQRVHG
ncbi:hypothetical protein SHA02_25690 [Salisediminibacterium halotolerans]|nr:hypothetical protein SHA02_25690 [Salisediminibacterium halotolerans]